MDRGHAKCFRVGVLEIIEASKRVVAEARGGSVDEVGALGVLKNLLEGTFHCVCGIEERSLGGGGLREQWS